MSSKNNPGAFDCYAAAHPDEEMFHLLGRDCMGGSLARLWAAAREQTGEEPAKIAEARDVGARMDVWCRDLGKTPVDVLDLVPFEVLANAIQRRSGVVMMQVQPPGDTITVNCERARVPHLVLTGKQIAELNLLAGDEPECEISIAFGDASSHAGPGLYAWHSEYPDEGAHPLFDMPQDAAEWKRDDEATSDLLGLVGLDAPAAVVATWSDEQVKLAEHWAGTTHLHASDNDHVKVPPRPSFLPEPWTGPEKGEGIWATNPTPVAPMLWAVHVTGSDDIWAAPNFDEALTAAARFNDWYDKLEKTENDPIMVASVVPYTGDADSHAKTLKNWNEFGAKAAATSTGA